MVLGFYSRNFKILNDMEQMLAIYGWTLQGNEVFNSKGTKVVLIEEKGNKYTFRDMAGNKLLSGNKNITEALEMLLKNYYYCRPTPNRCPVCNGIGAHEFNCSLN